MTITDKNKAVHRARQPQGDWWIYTYGEKVAEIFQQPSGRWEVQRIRHRPSGRSSHATLAQALSFITDEIDRYWRWHEAMAASSAFPHHVNTRETL